MIKIATVCSGIGSPEQALKVTIYKATFPNNKCYIGLTRSKLEQRISEHKYRGSVDKITLPFYNAMRKYGFENITWQVLSTHRTLSWAEKQEIKMIALHPNNYNVSTGGNASLITLESRQKISEKLKGRVFSEAWRGKISATLKQKFSDREERKLISMRTKSAMWRTDVRANYLAGRASIDRDKQQRLYKETRARIRVEKFLILSKSYTEGMCWSELHKITGISIGFMRKYKSEWQSN